MNTPIKDRLLLLVTQLIAEGGQLLQTESQSGFVGLSFVDEQFFHRWWGKVTSFGHQLASAAKPWEATFGKDPKSSPSFVRQVLGTLEAIKHEIDNDHLGTFTQLVRAETLTDLLDQAKHLFEGGYHLAAGALGRAVLEEHLRMTSASLGCSPSKPRPTINDFNQALYKAQHYSKIRMKEIDTLASIGNEAAHNKPGLDRKDVQKLLADLPDVIEVTGV